MLSLLCICWEAFSIPMTFVYRREPHSQLRLQLEDKTLSQYPLLLKRVQQSLESLLSYQTVMFNLAAPP